MKRPRIEASQAGFTVVELAATMVIVAVLVTLSASAMRHFWLVRELHGGQDAVYSQLRAAQERSAAESYPNVYGTRFQKSTATYSLVRYNASTATCTVVNTKSLPGGLYFATSTDFPDVTGTTTCGGGPATSYEIVFFYPKGAASAATGGSTVTITQPATGRTKSVAVLPITGRVSRV